MTCPPLKVGDHFSRAEFERRYEAMPHVKKAELVGGVVRIVERRVKAISHGQPVAYAAGWAGTYLARTPGVDACLHTSTRLLDDGEVQPDLAVLIEPSRGGQTTVSEDDFLEGAPELVFEVAESAACYDLHEKFELYERAGVREYVVWRFFDRMIDWFELEGGRYVRREPDADGLHRSRVFPGLWLDPAALIGDDLSRVLDRLNAGLATPEHAAFVARLNPPKAE